jgi:transcription initiation factor TFIID TATA-box-binding protein
MRVVNVIGSGAFDQELDLYKLADDDSIPNARYEPEHHHGMYLSFGEDAPLITVYRTGKYIIRAGSFNELEETRGDLLDLFSELGIDEVEDTFGVRNVVCTDDLGRDVNLNALSVELGLEDVEYEPEQFPGLIYRAEDGVILVFGSGKVVVTGADSKEGARDAFGELKTEMERQ